MSDFFNAVGQFFSALAALGLNVSVQVDKSKTVVDVSASKSDLKFHVEVEP